MVDLTPKQEAFARAFASGDYASASAVYREVYDCENSKPRTIRIEASRLLDNPNVALAIKELRAEAAKGARFTLEGYLNEFADLYRKCQEKDNMGAAVAAWEKIGKACGFYVERTEDVTPERQMTPEQLRETLLEAIEADPELQHAVISRLMDSGALAKHHGANQQEGGRA